jgi:hypothetical protein
MDHSQIDIFLLSCLKTVPPPSGSEQAGVLTETDWAELLEQSARHGVTPLLYHRLKTIHPDIVIPPDITGKLRQAYLENAARNIRLYHNLGDVLKRFRDHAIPVIALKGAHLAERVYENRALRYMGDLDLLVKKDALAKADALLIEMGCTPNEQNRIVGSDNNEFVYVMPKRDVSLEIHWGLLSPQFPFPIDTEGLWERVRPVCIAGVEVAVFCPEDLLLHLCIHAGCTHGFEPGLKLFCDINEIMQRNPDELDWAVLLHRSREWGVSKCVYLTLKLTGELLETAFPEAVMEALRPDDFDERFIVLARDQIFSRRARTGPPLSMWPAVARFWGTPGIWNKGVLFLKGFFIPRATMARLYPVPADSLKIYFYYFVRLKDLLRTYGHDLLRWLRRDQTMQAFTREGSDLTTLKDWLSSHKPDIPNSR